MTKKEIIWREILYQALERKVFKFTQKNLAEKLGFSLSTVFNALKVPRQAGAVKVSGRFFEVVDMEKLLAIWATYRNLAKEVIYQTRLDLPVSQIVGQLPAEVVLGGYSAYQARFKEAPADYDKVYVYADNLAEIKKRFPKQSGGPSLIVLKPDANLKNYGQRLTLAQLFVDLWNLKEWQAKDFLESLKKKIF
ncbi:helix-turn-helix domain-containing protein [Patescibacteria group bacterium]|nr:helix-turn-helix domain-containing protein [Patescibacteria group bacterium]